MITPEQKCKFLSLLQKECPFNVVDFQVEEDEVDMYWITLPLPEPYEGFDARNILFALDFESVNFREKSIRFVISEEDLVNLIERISPQSKASSDKLTN